jgi:Right handed beta helix region
MTTTAMTAAWRREKGGQVRRMLLLAVVVGACAGAVHVGTAQAISPCGTFNASGTLTADCEAPLIVNASGITVNLGGHKVICNADIDGLTIDNGVSSALVENGRVTSGSSTCANDIIVEGDSNRLLGLGADDADNQGIVVDGDKNQLTAVDSSFNTNDGVIVLGDGNIVRSSRFTGNGDDGAGVFLGSFNILQHNYVAFNGDKGIIVGGDHTSIFNNQSAFNSTAGIYLSDGSTLSVVYLNQTYRNDVGIWINNTSSLNIVIINGSYANFIWDMEDDNANCDSNNWFTNLFTTANQACIG